MWMDSSCVNNLYDGNSLPFMQLPKRDKKLWFWPIVTIGLWSILLLVVVGQNFLHPDRLRCLEDYLIGARHWIRGIPLYSYDLLGYIYSPFAAVCYVPLTLFPPIIARTLWQIFQVAVLLIGLDAMLRYGPFQHIPLQRRIWAFLLILPFVGQNLDSAQANPMIIGLIMIAVSAASLQRWTIAAIAIAAAIHWKVYPIVVAMLLILVTPVGFTWRLLVAVLAMALIPFFCQKPSYVLEQYQLWCATRLQDNRFVYPLNMAPLDFWFVLVRWGQLPMSEMTYRIIQVVSGAAIAGFCLAGRLRHWSQERILGGLFFFASGWMVLFGPSTESDTYLLVAPAIVLAVLESLSKEGAATSRFLAFCAYFFLLLGVLRQAFWPHICYPFPSTLLVQPIGAIFLMIYATVRSGIGRRRFAAGTGSMN